MAESNTSAKKIQLKAWVPADLARRWKGLAEARGLSQSALQELVMHRVLDGDDEPVGLPVRTANAKKRHVSIKLRDDEIAAVRRAAKHEGHSLAGWVAMLIRARLRAAPSFTGVEVAALLQASTQLMAIGRNINAAVRKLHADGKWGQHNQPMLAALEKCRELEARINALQAAAERRSAF